MKRIIILLMIVFSAQLVNPVDVKKQIPYTMYEPRRAEVQINDTLLVVRTVLSHNNETWEVIHQEEIKEGEVSLNVLLNNHQRVKIVVTTNYYGEN